MLASAFTLLSESFESQEPNPQTSFSNGELLSLAENIRSCLSVLPPDVKFAMPQVVVVGAQSSGKSSFLNGLIGHPVFPTGKEMTTRCPFRLELRCGLQREEYLEFGHHSVKDGSWVSEKKLPLTEIGAIRSELLARNQLLGEVVNARLFAHHAPDLTLVDLPGLTQVACTDLGQPKDLPSRLRKMSQQFAQEPGTIVAVVMAARADLETDPALALVRSLKPNPTSLGVLTKVDRLSDGPADIQAYLEGRASRDLQLTDGYYAVRNGLAPAEEKQFFREWGSIRQRCGISNLGKALSERLIQALQQALPTLLGEIRQREAQLKEELLQLGPAPTEDGFTERLLIKFLETVRQNLEVKHGTQLKDAFCQYRSQTQEPAQELMFQPHEVGSGNHMDILGPTVEALERALPPTLFMERFGPGIVSLHQAVTVIVKAAITDACEQILHRFPQLKLAVSSLCDEKIATARAETQELLDNLLQMEGSYIWVDDPEFLALCAKTHKPGDVTELARVYLTIIHKHLKHTVPKAIMAKFIRRLPTQLGACLIGRRDLRASEASSIEQKRSQLRETLTTLQAAQDHYCCVSSQTTKQ